MEVPTMTIDERIAARKRIAVRRRRNFIIDSATLATLAAGFALLAVNIVQAFM